MEFNEFRNKVKEALPDFLTDDLRNAEIKDTAVNKLQGESYSGISVTPEGSHVGVSINLEDAFHLFLFCGRRCDRIKALHFEKDGFCLLYKRLDNGRFQWPRNSSEVRNLTRQEYRWLLEGLSIDQPKAIRPAGKKDF